MITYNNIITYFNDIATNHTLINSFHSGFLDEVDIDKMDSANFPILYVEPTTSVMGDGYLNYSFNVLVLDMVLEDLTDRNTVWTNTLQILQDVIADFRQNLALQPSGADSGKKFSYVDGQVVLEMPISADPFTARFANLLTGWSGSFTMQVNNSNNLCDAPITPSDNNPITDYTTT